jgi:hypothetical protein
MESGNRSLQEAGPIEHGMGSELEGTLRPPFLHHSLIFQMLVKKILDIKSSVWSWGRLGSKDYSSQRNSPSDISI